MECVCSGTPVDVSLFPKGEASAEVYNRLELPDKVSSFFSTNTCRELVFFLIWGKMPRFLFRLRFPFISSVVGRRVLCAFIQRGGACINNFTLFLFVFFFCLLQPNPHDLKHHTPQEGLGKDDMYQYVHDPSQYIYVWTPRQLGFTLLVGRFASVQKASMTFNQLTTN